MDGVWHEKEKPLSVGFLPNEMLGIYHHIRTPVNGMKSIRVIKINFKLLITLDFKKEWSHIPFLFCNFFNRSSFFKLDLKSISFSKFIEAYDSILR